MVTERADDDHALIDPRSGVAAMLEAMLPHESSDDPDRVVPPSLRGLPSRLRDNAPGGRRDLEDLMAILQWHSGGVPRQIVRELADRVRNPQPTHTVGAVAPIDALDLFPAEEMPRRLTPGRSERARERTADRRSRTGGPVTQINAAFEGRSRNYHPRVSPDSRRIAYHSRHDGTWKI